MNLALPQTLKYSPYAITLGEYLEPADEKKIKAVFDAMQSAWDKKDAVAFGNCFTEDSDFVSFRGDHYKGKADNIHAHEKLFTTVLKNTNLHVNVKAIRFLNDEMAVVHAEGAVLQPWQQAGNCTKLSYNTNLLVKENGQWKITSFHNTRKQKSSLIEKISKWFS